VTYYRCQSGANHLKRVFLVLRAVAIKSPFGPGAPTMHLHGEWTALISGTLSNTFANVLILERINS